MRGFYVKANLESIRDYLTRIDNHVDRIIDFLNALAEASSSIAWSDALSEETVRIYDEITADISEALGQMRTLVDRTRFILTALDDYLSVPVRQ